MKNNIVKDAKAQVKANKQPRTIKVKSLIKALVISAIILLTAGVFYNLGQYNQRQSTADIDQKAIIRVQDIKALMTVVK